MIIKDFDMEILKDVLCGDLPESDARFGNWLKMPGNQAAYKIMCGEEMLSDDSFRKEEAYREIAAILNFKQKSRGVLLRRSWKLVAIAAVAVLATLFLLVPFFSRRGDSFVQPSHFQVGDKIAYLNTSKGEIIPLKEDFILKDERGTVVSNSQKEGTLSVEQIAQPSVKTKMKPENQILSVPKGGEYSILLADGSKVYLNSETQLVFPDRFTEGPRKVHLTGEAFFEIVHTGEPFIVEVNGMSVEVKGTSFNINTRSIGSLVRTTLVEGRVDVHLNSSGESVSLCPSEQLSYNPVSGQMTISEVDTDVYTSWRNGIFMFRNQTLEEIFDQLSRWYNFKIEYKRPDIAGMHFSGSAEKKRELDFLLDRIQMVADIKCKKEGDTITLY